MPVFYFSKTIIHETADTRFVETHCDSCGKEYFYPLARTGHGYGTAHYHLGTKQAAENAA